MNSERYIEVRQLNKKFGYKTALRNIDFVLQEGESLALFGPNGAGKSTLVQVMCSLLRPTSGSVRIAGYEARRDREALHQIIGLIGHQTLLYPHLTAYENLKFYGAMYRVDRLHRRITEVLDLVGLSGNKKVAVQNFSRGMQQRLSIGRAIIHDPKIIFLDEPFTGLDQQGSEDFIKLILQFRNQGKTMVMASHQLHLGLELCSRAAILKSGKMVYLQDTARISQNEFKQIYSQQIGENAPQLKVA
ncbi:MAG: heme ABC exporter ATP-binding protein CcmA [Desulfobacterales bacterium]|nr:MAG: heme ABC exporter ATP-binding protein CcmA [Desulfobacterales bacterium]